MTGDELRDRGRGREYVSVCGRWGEGVGHGARCSERGLEKLGESKRRAFCSGPRRRSPAEAKEVGRIVTTEVTTAGSMVVEVIVGILLVIISVKTSCPRLLFHSGKLLLAVDVQVKCRWALGSHPSLFGRQLPCLEISHHQTDDPPCGAPLVYALRNEMKFGIAAGGWSTFTRSPS